MAYSTQRATSDGTLQVLPVSIEFFEQSEILVFVDNTPWTAYSWQSATTILFDAPIEAGLEVLLRRETEKGEPRHTLSAGSPFTYNTLDENFTQSLRIAQEAIEGANVGDIYRNLDMHGNRIRNLGDAIDPGDAVNLGQLQGWNESALSSAIKAAISEANAAASAEQAMLRAMEANNLPHTLRTAFTEPALTEIPPIASRAGKVLSFDFAGMPQMYVPVPESALELGIALADQTDPTKGAARIGRSIQVIANLAALRALSKDSPSRAARTLGYWTEGDGGGATWRLRVGDTTSAENGKIIIATDGARWEMQDSPVNIRQFGACAVGSTDDAPYINQALQSRQRGETVLVNADATAIVGTDVIIPRGVGLIGLGASPEIPGFGSNIPDIWSMGRQLRVKPGATIRMQGGAVLFRALVTQFNITGSLPTAGSFAGTAITMVGNDNSVVDNMILGFALGVHKDSGVPPASSNGCKVRNNRFDCTAGVRVINSGDVDYIEDNRFSPFVTMAHPAPDTSATASHYLHRAGVAIYIDNAAWPHIRNNFSFGYSVGLDILNCSNPTVTDNGFEGVPLPAAPWTITVAGIRCTLTHGGRFSHNVLVHHGLGLLQVSGEGNAILSNYVRNTVNQGILIQGGSAQVGYNNVNGRVDTTQGIFVAATARHVIVDNNHMDTCRRGITCEVGTNVQVGDNNSFGTMGQATLWFPNDGFGAPTTMTMDIKPSIDYVRLGNGTFNFVNPTRPGHRVLFLANGTVTVLSSGNIRLLNGASSIAMTAGQILELVCTGPSASAVWKQVGPANGY